MSDQPNPKKLFVGNLAYSVTQADLEQLFGQYGELASVSLITDKMSGRSKGFAFVEYTTEEAAKAAVEALHGQMFQDRDLVVNEARPMTDRPRRSFGGGGRDFGGNRGGSRGGFGGNRSGGGRGGFGGGRDY